MPFIIGGGKRQMGDTFAAASVVIIGGLESAAAAVRPLDPNPPIDELSSRNGALKLEER